MTDFKSIETARQGTLYNWEDISAAVKFNSNGLIPGIAQQFDSGEVLMLAWLNAKSLEETITTGRVCYWSRSRQQYWRKGEMSGQVQRLKELRFDCDGDTILLLVDQKGPACHTGRRSCFYLGVTNKDVDNDDKNRQTKVLSDPLIAPEKLYQK